MPEWIYRDRSRLLAGERVFTLGPEAIEIVEGERRRSIRYADIRYIEVYSVRLIGQGPRARRWLVHTTNSRPFTITIAARERWRVVDRRAAFTEFAHELERRIVAVNPELYFVVGRLLLNRAGGLGGKIAVRLLRFVRHTNPDRWADFAAFVMRQVGPRLRGHQRALEQLALAFPEKSAEELQRIAVGMWDNLARTVVEYSQLDRLWDHDPARPGSGRIVLDEASGGIWDGIRRANRPMLGFSMHSANWELSAIAISKHGFKSLIPYRRTRNEALTNELVRMRVAAGCKPLPAGRTMVSDIRREFGPGVVLGMLIDQYYAHGMQVTMFGRATLLNPLFARLARIYDAPIYGSRIVRLPDRRLHHQVIGPIEPVRDGRGRIDVQATLQTLATVMEGWIREHPEQWLWLHRLWRDERAPPAAAGSMAGPSSEAG